MLLRGATDHVEVATPRWKAVLQVATGTGNVYDSSLHRMTSQGPVGDAPATKAELQVALDYTENKNLHV
jgi:hypothetical protein